MNQFTNDSAGPRIDPRWDHAESDWNRQVLADPQVDPVCCQTPWMFSYHETFSPQRRLYLRQADQSLIAFAEQKDWFDFPVLAPVESHWFFGNPLAGPASVELLADLLLEAHRIHKTTYPAVFIGGLWKDCPVAMQLLDFPLRPYEMVFFRQEQQCFASLENGLDGYLGRRSAALRRNLKKHMKRARSQGVYFERHKPADVQTDGQVYQRMLAVEQKSWKGIGHCGMTESPACEFYQRMLERLATNVSGRVIFARHEDQDIGFIFGALAGPYYRGQQFSFVDEWKKYSIGNLLQLEQIHWLTEEGVERYDMGPLMAYKTHWTEIRKTQQSWVLRLR